MSEQLIQLILFILIYIYNVCQLNYFNKLLTTRFSSRMMIIFLSLFLTLVSMFLITYKIFIPLTYFILSIVLYFSLRLCFTDLKSVIFIICINIVFQLVLTRDIVIGVSSLITNQSMYTLVQDKGNYMLSFCVSRIIVLFILFNFNKLLPLDIAKKILMNIPILKFTILVKGTLVILMLNSNYIDFYSANIKTTTIPLLMNRGIIALCYYFLLFTQIQQIKFKEVELNNKLISLQLEHQEELYKKRDHYAEILRTYNHDFKSVLTNVSYFLDQGDIQKAKEILKTIDSDIKVIITENQSYSNRLIVDVILNSLAEKCKQANIEFNAECLIPEHLSLTDLSLSRIFGNLANNAYEACIKQDQHDERKITFKSYIKDDFFIIYTQNSFNGEIIIEHNRIRTTKQNKKQHGVGIESIKNIVESANGIALFDVNEEKNMFRFYIKIPLSHE
ncbi:sensor histidine kinase [Turicibacter bilis]|uniref:Sensor histidine kinase n=1 Tax=Turicibacter bilis TaxID=2735723 RepID=A0ABY5JDX0_9FIRM|nr:GHKL domain-containing protein [Turicibacter bilis]MBS3199949.1 sensor histidine kinase [Turicibacter bilis]UUF04887.1 sensor histidine kinase [Turicibacter bilis]